MGLDHQLPRICRMLRGSHPAREPSDAAAPLCDGHGPGGLGYGPTSIFGAIVAEIFEGKHFGSIFGTLMLASIVGGALGPWATGALYDAEGTYAPAFWI